MAQPKLLCSIFLACVLMLVEAAGTTPHSLLECRVCRSAIFLDDCNETQLCSHNEECYIDEIITPQLQIIFNAGCRSSAICKSPDPHGRKRAAEGLIACSHCCNTPKNETSTECNANLCGIKLRTTPHSLLECRLCRNAIFLEDCNETQLCSHNEECYIDEIITPQLQIIFNAGCRSSAICKSPDPHGRKRAAEGLIACSHCCNTPKNETSTECNANLCGIKLKSGDHRNQCYFCGDDEDANQGAITDIRKCRKIKFCPDDEVCRVATKNTAGIITHELGCQQKLQCQLITVAALEQRGVNTGVDIQHLSVTGELLIGRKRQLAICDICCADSLCNDYECSLVRARIVTFAKEGRFNYTTLRIM